jgi:hypothetical protein
MLKKITSYDHLRSLKELTLGNADATNEKYKIIQVDKRSIKMIRRGKFPDSEFCLLKIYWSEIGILILTTSSKLRKVDRCCSKGA